MTVALAVHNYTNGDGTMSFAGADRISKDTGVSKSTVERGLKFLRDEGLIHLDRRGGRSGDGAKWASEYSLRIPDKWSDVAEAERKDRESQPFTNAYQTVTTDPQPATSAGQPATHVTDHQIRSITSDSSDPRTSDPAPERIDAFSSSPSELSITKASGATGDRSWWEEEPPF